MMHICTAAIPKPRVSNVIRRRPLLSSILILGHLVRPVSAPLHSVGQFSARTVLNMANQDRLVRDLVEEGVIKHRDVEEVMKRVDRAYFSGNVVPKKHAYVDTPLPIGYGETISAPHMHASCLEMLHGHLKPGARVLDVGSGSGYLSVAMALMVGENGKVVGIEKHPELAEESINNVRSFMPELLDSGRLELKAGNVLGDALEHEQAFDVIHVGAAAERLPDVLVKKLNKGGRMVIPVGRRDDFQVMEMIDVDMNGDVKKKDLMYVRYVPLTKPGEGGFSEL